MVAAPWATLVTKPLPFTPATAATLLDHEIERPERRLPAESVVVAVSCTAAPTSRLTTAGVTFTEATAAGTTVMVVVSEAEELPWPRATSASKGRASFISANRHDSLCLKVMTRVSSTRAFVTRRNVPPNGWAFLRWRDGCQREGSAMAGTPAPAAACCAHARQSSALFGNAPGAAIA